MKKINPKEIGANIIELIEKRWMLVTAGTIDDFNTMTANWGAMGELWYKDVAFIFIRPQRYTFEFTERENMVSLSFFGDEYRKALQICGSTSGRDTDKMTATGLTPFTTENGCISFKEAEMIIECRKLYAETLNPEAFTDPAVISRCYPNRDFHKMYVLEIIAVWIK